MKPRVNAAVAAVLAASLVVSYAQASDATPPAKKHHAKKEKTPPEPPCKIRLRPCAHSFRARSTRSRASLPTKDAQLQQAQQAAADAQAAAAKAQAEADAAAAGAEPECGGGYHAASPQSPTSRQPGFAGCHGLRRDLGDQEGNRQPGRASLQGHHPLARRQLPGGRNRVALSASATASTPTSPAFL